MAFRLPTFNVNVNIWRGTNAVTNPPDVTALGNLSPGRFTTIFSEASASAPVSSFVTDMLLRLPPLTDIRDGILGTTGRDNCEVPAGSGRFYAVIYVDDVAKGFTNEHRYAMIAKGSRPWPEPIP